MSSTMTRKRISNSAARRVAIEAAGFGTDPGVDSLFCDDFDVDTERALDALFVEEDPTLGDSGSGVEDEEGYALRALGLHWTTQSAAESDRLEAEYDEVVRPALADRISSKPYAERDDQEAFLLGLVKAIDAKLRPLKGAELGTAITEIEANIADLPNRFGFGAYDCEGVAKSHAVRQTLRRARARYDAWLGPVLTELARREQANLRRELTRAMREQGALDAVVREVGISTPTRSRNAKGNRNAKRNTTAKTPNRSNRRGAKKVNNPGQVGAVASTPTSAKGNSKAAPSRNRRRNRRPAAKAS
jgi:hypothetical protein